MLDEENLEKRLVTLEQVVSDLQQKVESQPISKDWLQDIIGSISDDTAFLEALEYGRSFRQQNQQQQQDNQ